MTLPLPVTPIRFCAALWLFIFGTLDSLSCGGGRGGCRGRRPRGRRFALLFRRRWLGGFGGVGGFRDRGGLRDRGGRGLRAVGPDVRLWFSMSAANGLVALRLVGRSHRDVHRLAFEQRCPFRDPVIADSLHEPGDQVAPDLRMRELASPEADGDL